MAFKMSAQKSSGKVSEVVIGTGEKAITLGGENVLPFYSFDGDTGNIQKVGIEINDIYPETWIDSYKEMYKDVANDPAAWAKYVQDNSEADFICLRFVGADPNADDKSPEECAEVAKKVADAIDLPLVVAGCGVAEKDGKLFAKVAEALEGKNVLILSAVEDNYKEVGAAAGLAYGQKVGAESAVDINLAKQMNVLLTQLGVKPENIVMNIGCSAVGYGYEYVASTIDRIRLAAFNQNDKQLQIPIVTPVSFEVGHVKEAIADEADQPEWGCSEKRSIAMEVSTATAVLVGGSDAVILRHPESVKTIKSFISELA
ncbi:MAG: acetyl-CoA decarbonylase/synthase complex subunit delta [Terrisporobacter othiniensis]|uniref:Acetyl-CoA decarbonylase/synthase complex subunit delta n=1 Tax=Terrisporobacter hibernicus TaxID=2813371 RepID=A0AAX2ZAT5_9FIRM|nr:MULTISPECIES: acetyl-CoA decarbonylase/synthase complex subunit delta [Terrisporobacter]MDU4861892.1 acetyl-CoA decarbonylase/synthase complex subunit delta [Terrisporobacter othiniensis]MDU6995811.1 acetyl-CoA decarbonylase/synthase complex subunit delta [Terrisporobacter othiniensis]UEL46157.1 acetyl-CoA decarbonylase/synthase complex subunit delta [Terrisporobacter hibernicus]SFJ61936.1 CO-methylating acetyl-CoA synthase corrinoid iron-sulfur protein small subunit precursor /acetyl-CoA de